MWEEGAPADRPRLRINVQTWWQPRQGSEGRWETALDSVQCGAQSDIRIHKEGELLRGGRRGGDES